MLIQNLFEPYEIEYMELNECPVGIHKNTYFELVYILKGSGVHHVGDNQFNYSKGTLFLLLPQHAHSFDVRELTTFLFIRFNDIYLKAQQVKDVHSMMSNWIQKMEYILRCNYDLPGCILHNANDKPLIGGLMDALIRELVNQHDFYREVIQQLVNTVLTIVARNIWRINAGKAPPRNDHAAEMIRYIHEQIYSPDQLKAEKMAAHFNISPGYIHEYFRKHLGESLQQYIAGYKMKLVENRLLYSKMRVSEIVQELGFTDESHLNRFFKKHTGLSPTAFRKAGRALPLSPTDANTDLTH